MSGSRPKRSRRGKMDIPAAEPVSAPRKEKAPRRSSAAAPPSPKAKRKSVSDGNRKKLEKAAAKQAKAAERQSRKAAPKAAPQLGEAPQVESSAPRRDVKTTSRRDTRTGRAIEGRRVGDIRAAERAEAARKRYRTYLFRIGIIILAVIAVFFGSIFLYRSNAFQVEKVTVSGVSRLTDQEITQLAAISDDSTLLRLDTAGITERLETHAWIQRARVRRHLFNTIELVITERTPAAVVRLNEMSIWVISTDGAWLSAATEDDWASTHRIIDVNPSLPTPVAGNECSDEGITNAIAIYNGVSEELAEQIDSISAESAVKAQLTLTNGVTVAFGTADELEIKEADIWELLEQYEGTISYINVRTPSRPTYRTM